MSARNQYLRLDVHDPDILVYCSDRERRLRNYEYHPWLNEYPEPLKRYSCIQIICFD